MCVLLSICLMKEQFDVFLLYPLSQAFAPTKHLELQLLLLTTALS